MTSVSVIIPTFNRAGFLPACIESVLVSGIPRLEILVVDDGSTDHTRNVVRSYSDPVRYLRQDNTGPASARNLGARCSRGKYVCFLDSDDRWLTGGPARLLAALEQHQQYAVAFGDTLMGNDESGFVSFVGTYGAAAFYALPGVNLDSDLRLFERGPLFRQLAIRNVMFLGSLLVRRKTFEEVGGFHEQLRGAADWDLFLRLAARFEIVYLVTPPAARYLKHEVAMSNNSSHMERDFMLALAHVLKAVDNLCAADRNHVRRLLRQHRFNWAYSAYDSGDLHEARRRFLEAAWLSGPSMPTLAYLALSCAPPAVVRQVRHLRRRIVA